MSCEPAETLTRIPNEATPELDLPEGVPPLASLYLYASGSCNLACRHCWITPTFQPDGDNGQHVKLEHVRKAIQEGTPLGLRSVKLTGGEPTLNPRFRELVTLIDEAGLDIKIETNGTLIDDALAGLLKQTPHVSFISVSLDGATAETHEYLRGVPGSYERAIAGVKALVEAGFHPQLICSVHRGNVSQMAEVVALAERLGCGSVKFNYVQAVGRGKRFAEEHGLGVAEIIRTYRHTEKELSSQSKIPVLFNVPFAFYPTRKLLNDRLSKCTVTTILGILSDGARTLVGNGVRGQRLI